MFSAAVVCVPALFSEADWAVVCRVGVRVLWARGGSRGVRNGICNGVKCCTLNGFMLMSLAEMRLLYSCTSYF